MWTYLIYANGKEVENLTPGTFANEAEAMEAAESEIDDLCPPLSPNRKYYRAVTALATKRAPVVPLGSICHNDDNHNDPSHRRVGIWLDVDGKMWADADAPYVAHEDTFSSVESARKAARRSWGGPQWAYRDED